MNNDRGFHTLNEIMSQGKVWQATLNDFDRQAKVITDLIRKPYQEVIFTGCGSTYYLSMAAAAMWQSLTGIRARGVPASELWLFPDTVLSEKNMLLV
jgi:glutamine---fructose-6-phosphate transaminase (isomerizing)